MQTPTELFNANLDLVDRIANPWKRHRSTTFDFDDILSNGRIGLWHASTSYHDKTRPFRKYAAASIANWIRNSVRDDTRARCRHSGKKLIEKVVNLCGDMPADGCYYTTLFDTIPDESLVPADEQLIEAENMRLIIHEIANLPQEQSLVMAWRYNSDDLKTQHQIADIMGVKRQRIGQIEESAIAILRKRLAYSQK